MSDAPSATPVLRVQGLSFSYPGRHVFTDWSADFAPGLSWVRGSNGSGKSTLLKLLAGALLPLAGRIAAQGIEIAQSPLDYRRQVFWCGPGEIAFDHLRAAEFYAFMRSLYPTFETAAALAFGDELGLAPHAGKRLRELSTGTQRKVWLAAAFAAGTPVLLLDEPLNALDQTSLRILRARLARRAADAQRACIVVSHEGLGEAAEAGARRIEMPEPS